MCSGRSVDLAIFEDTTVFLNSTTNYNEQQRSSELPSARELWLQMTVGYWVDTILNVQRQTRGIPSPGSGGGEIQREDVCSSRNTSDDLRFLIKTKESLQRLVNESLVVTEMEDAAQEKTMNRNTTLPVSTGAISMVEWCYDLEDKAFHFQLHSE
jgi:hypothetical protein